jgi:hypothetical protein
VNEPTTGSPEWWLRHLTARQQKRRRMLQRLDEYYRGEHPLEFATEQFREAFGGMFDQFADNWCGVVVDATEERLDVEGFRFGDTATDELAWDIWQRNDMDAESQLGHLEALIHAEAYTLVWPGSDVPRITVEHPLQMIAAPSPSNHRVTAAALKWYVDDDGYEVAYLYLPDQVHRYRSSTRTRTGLRDWNATRWVAEDRDATEDPAVQDNPFGVVPVTPLQNRPRLIAQPRSEIEIVVPLQDAINKLWADLMVASEFTADAQRWMLGYEPDIDEETNQPKPPPWKRRDRLWYVPQTDAQEHPVQIGQFSAGSLENYLGAIETAVQHIASQTRTPPHYLNPGADRLSGESIKASESGLVEKVRRKQRFFGEAWERTMRLALQAAGSDLDFAAAETIWKDPEQHSEAELADAAMKRKVLGVTRRQTLEDLGYTPTQIARMNAERAAEQLEDELFGAAGEPPAPA